MQFKKRGQVKAVRRANELEVLAVEGRRIVVMIFQPGVRVHNELDADQPSLVPIRFVNQSFGMLDVKFSIADQGALT